MTASVIQRGVISMPAENQSVNGQSLRYATEDSADNRRGKQDSFKDANFGAIGVWYRLRIATRTAAATNLRTT